MNQQWYYKNTPIFSFIAKLLLKSPDFVFIFYYCQEEQ